MCVTEWQDAKRDAGLNVGLLHNLDTLSGPTGRDCRRGEAGHYKAFMRLWKHIFIQQGERRRRMPILKEAVVLEAHPEVQWTLDGHVVLQQRTRRVVDGLAVLYEAEWEAPQFTRPKLEFGPGSRVRPLRVPSPTGHNAADALVVT